jgi:DNA-binding protein
MSENNVVYIGKKPVMNYVMAVLTRLNKDGSREVTLRARGRSISIAVDTAEITRNRFISDLNCEINIGTERLTGMDGEPRDVSTMEIRLSKGPVGKVVNQEEKLLKEKTENSNPNARAQIINEDVPE